MPQDFSLDVLISTGLGEKGKTIAKWVGAKHFTLHPAPN